MDMTNFLNNYDPPHKTVLYVVPIKNIIQYVKYCNHTCTTRHGQFTKMLSMYSYVNSHFSRHVYPAEKQDFYVQQLFLLFLLPRFADE